MKRSPSGCRALRVAAPGRFAVVQACQMRLRLFHDEPELGRTSALSSPSRAPRAAAIKVVSSQTGSMTWNGVRWQRRNFTLLARSASFTRAALPARDPRNPGPPLR